MEIIRSLVSIVETIKTDVMRKIRRLMAKTATRNVDKILVFFWKTMQTAEKGMMLRITYFSCHLLLGTKYAYTFKY